jgi:hypothetical protein
MPAGNRVTFAAAWKSDEQGWWDGEKRLIDKTNERPEVNQIGDCRSLRGIITRPSSHCHTVIRLISTQ